MLAGVFFVLFRESPKRIIVYSLLFIGFVLFGSGFAVIDPFLNEWDEQYHALVAKNMSLDFLNPKLIAHSPVNIDHKMWIYCGVWLHKQPLFLWQIACSIKVFGVNIWAVRFPSVLLHALTALMAYSIGKRYLEKGFAILITVLFGCSGYFNDFTSGAIGMDHNDVAFVFYVTATFWAWLNYREQDDKSKWQILIGVFSAGAILCKWLVGLVVFSGWGTVILFENWKNIKSWVDLIKSFLITIILVIPWQLYCYLKYPTEFLYEMNYNSKHFTHVIENHGGDSFFYWEQLKDSFGSGELVRWVLVLGFVLFCYKELKKKGEWLFAVVVFVVTYTFFTFAATKITGYVSIVAIFGFIFLIYPFQRLFFYIKSRREIKVPNAFKFSLIVFVFFFQFSPKGVVDRHKYLVPEYRKARMNELHTALEVLNSDPDFKGYFLLKGDKTNVLTSLLFLTEKKIIYYSPETENVFGDKQNYRLLDLGKE